MNIAIVLAGGVGSRMGKDIPKQFVLVKDKPILVYTLESFQNNSHIDYIEVVCLKDWESHVWEYVKKYGITKLKWIVHGGNTGQESIRNGVYNLRDKCKNDDNIIIHDGIRPLVDIDVINDVLDKCDKYGNGVTSTPYNEQLFVKDDAISTVRYIPREIIRKVATPQAYKFKLLYEKYKEAFDLGVGLQEGSYTNTMMVELGVRLYFAKGSDRNIKLTTPGDLEIFEAMLEKTNEIIK